MKFLLDANMPRSALRALIEAGHETMYVRALGMGDATDAAIDRFAQDHGLVLVTRDLDNNTQPRQSSLKRGAWERENHE